MTDEKRFRNNVYHGEVSEHIFQNICFVDHEYTVSKPTSTADYDLVVDVGDSVYKVQVKSSRKGNGNANICKGTGKSKRAYDDGAVDFFAVHDVPHDEWYIIPKSFTGDIQNIRLAYKRQGKYTQFKKNWGFKHVP